MPCCFPYFDAKMFCFRLASWNRHTGICRWPQDLTAVHRDRRTCLCSLFRDTSECGRLAALMMLESDERVPQPLPQVVRGSGRGRGRGRPRGRKQGYTNPDEEDEDTGAEAQSAGVAAPGRSDSLCFPDNFVDYAQTLPRSAAWPCSSAKGNATASCVPSLA